MVNHKNELIKQIIFITGFMASGKTTIGKLLAKKLSLNYYDTDELIEEKTGLQIYKIFEKYGENHFRKLERDVLIELIDKVKRTGGVISTGGGLPCYYNNMELMKKAGKVVYLEVNPEDVYKRIRNIKLRPVYQKLMNKENPLKEIEKLLKYREKYYKKADLRINTSKDKDSESVDSIVSRIIRAFSDSTSAYIKDNSSSAF